MFDHSPVPDPLDGAAERFDAVSFFWSNHYDVSIAYVGHAEQWDDIDVSGSFARFERGGLEAPVAVAADCA